MRIVRNIFVFCGTENAIFLDSFPKFLTIYKLSSQFNLDLQYITSLSCVISGFTKYPLGGAVIKT